MSTIKKQNSTTLTLTNSKYDGIQFSSTKYYQGREKAIYGPPYSITIGIPANDTNNTEREVIEQKTFINLYSQMFITDEDIFSSSRFLAIMINSSNKTDLLAYNEAHLKVLIELNKKSKVIKTHNNVLYYIQAYFNKLKFQHKHYHRL